MADEARELAELVASVRAFVEWHEVTGSVGLPLAGDLPAIVGLPEAEILPGRPPELLASTPVGLSRPPERPARPPVVLASTPEGLPRSPDRPARVADAPAPAPEAPARIAAAPAPRIEPPRPAPASADERVTRLALLAEKARVCERCVLCQKRKQAVFARGNPNAELVLVGEGPGADEDQIGEPFVGKAGQLLDRMIVAMGYARDDVYICNIVKCRPPENRKPEPDEMAACIPFLHEQLALVKPKAMIALGATAVQGLVGTTEGITRLRGKWKLYKGETPIMPTFHPAYLLRQPAAKREVWADLQEVMRLLGKGRK